MEFNNMELGKPIKKNGYTTIPLYDTTPIEDEHKDAFLESMDNAGLPNDLREWIYNEYINVKRPVTFQTPSMKMNLGSINECKFKTVLSLDLNQDHNDELSEFMTKMDIFMKKQFKDKDKDF